MVLDRPWCVMRLIGGLVVVALLCEVAIRILIGAPREEQLPLLRVQPDRRLGYRPIPGDQHYGYDELIKLNSLGWRGPEVIPKSPGEYRILALGGTQVYGLGIADTELLTSVLEDRLNQDHGARSYRVINSGVRAFTLGQQLHLLEDVGVTVEPDHVVVFIDIYSLGESNILKYYERIAARDWFMLDLDAKPVGIVLGKWYLIQAARQSALVTWLYSFYKVWSQRNSFASKLLRGEKDTNVERVLTFVKKHVDAFVLLANKHRFDLSLVLIPLPSQVSHDHQNLLYQLEFRNIALARGLPFFDLREPLRSLYQRTGHFPVAPFDAHYDALAHQAIAGFLLDAMRKDDDTVTVS